MGRGIKMASLSNASHWEAWNVRTDSHLIPVWEGRHGHVPVTLLHTTVLPTVPTVLQPHVRQPAALLPRPKVPGIHVSHFVPCVVLRQAHCPSVLQGWGREPALLHPQSIQAKLVVRSNSITTDRSVMTALGLRKKYGRHSSQN